MAILTAIQRIVGSDLQLLGIYNEAEVLRRWELSGIKGLLDNNSESDYKLEFDYLVALSNIASVLASQGKWEEAVRFHRDALVRSELHLGV